MKYKYPERTFALSPTFVGMYYDITGTEPKSIMCSGRSQVVVTGTLGVSPLWEQARVRLKHEYIRCWAHYGNRQKSRCQWIHQLCRDCWLPHFFPPLLFYVIEFLIFSWVNDHLEQISHFPHSFAAVLARTLKCLPMTNK